MAERKAGIIVILSSPSGAGKTTLVKKISSRNNFKISISHTTRKPRINEKDGKHYFFVKDKEFKKLIKQKKFLEYAKVFKNYYGSLKKNVVKKLEKSENVQYFQIFQKIKKKIQKTIQNTGGTPVFSEKIVFIFFCLCTVHLES